VDKDVDVVYISIESSARSVSFPRLNRNCIEAKSQHRQSCSIVQSTPRWGPNYTKRSKSTKWRPSLIYSNRLGTSTPQQPSDPVNFGHLPKQTLNEKKKKKTGKQTLSRIRQKSAVAVMIVPRSTYLKMFAPMDTFQNVKILSGFLNQHLLSRAIRHNITTFCRHLMPNNTSITCHFSRVIETCDTFLTCHYLPYTH